MAEGNEGTYRGEGFTGKRLGRSGPEKIVEPTSEPQPNPNVPYCQACKARAQWLPSGKLWCSHCNGTPVVLLPGRLAPIGSVALASCGALAMAVWVLFFGGIGAIEGLMNDGDGAAQSLASNPVANSTLSGATPESAEAIPTETQPLQCQSMAVGCDAAVTNTGTWLNVRDGPTIKGSIVGRLEDGDTLSVVGGPTQVDGYTWWQIRSSGDTGWVAEGDKDGTRWMIPASNTSASYPGSPESLANEPEYCQELAETRASLEVEGLWEYVKSQLELSPNGAYLSQCSVWD